MSSLKQVIVMRKDLGMRAGKMVAQGAHASVDSVLCGLADKDRIDLVHAWLSSGMPKICVRVESGDELLAVHEAAHAAGIAAHVVTDSGRTEFHGIPTVTCIAIGPDTVDRIDGITGHLKLL